MFNRYNPDQFEPYDDDYNEEAYYNHEELEWECKRNEHLTED